MIEQFEPANGKRAAMTSMKFKRKRNTKLFTGVRKGHIDWYKNYNFSQSGLNTGSAAAFATSYVVGRENKRTNNGSVMLPALKTNAALGHQGPD